MKNLKPKLLLAALVAATGLAAASSAQAAVSVTIGEPGFYGSIDIGGAPPPALIFPQPIISGPPVVGVAPPPLYLRVPPGYERDWGRYCGAYRACGRPVYFVQDRWYQETYVPHWRAHHDNGRHEGWEKHGRGRDDDDGPGRGHGHGRGHDRD